ncbi:hypothetical protein [Micrococcus luteus]|uniref:hypothetical protein n=1 Tax=Micrococcus luteus TaxID=1270 RepID=UPI00230249D7|nr:hypothetical protein [Micrococcus luteus]
MTDQTTPAGPLEIPLPADAPMHCSNDDAYDEGRVDGWHTGYRAGYTAALGLSPERQQALDALTAAWLTATGDEAAGPALAALAALAHPLFEALANLRDLHEAEARASDPDTLP